jgi:hypothetical protein
MIKLVGLGMEGMKSWQPGSDTEGNRILEISVGTDGDWTQSFSLCWSVGPKSH